jgi:HPt (histidine-containing phosphotransfer) domain-containing protein
MIYTNLKNPQDAPYHRIMRAAHVIKGAAANLMCGQLRQASYNLEQAASRAHEASHSATTAAISPELMQSVQLCYSEMQQARQNYLSYLQSIGV